MRTIHRIRVSLLAAATLTMSNIAYAQPATSAPKPPATEKKPHVTKIHGDTLVDNYFWLREKKNPDVIAHLEAENAYTAAMTADTIPLQTKLYDELLGHVKQTDVNVPYRLGGYYYYSRTEEGKQYPIYARKKGNLDAPEEITLDLNELAKGLKFLSLGSYRVSDDGNLLAYSTDPLSPIHPRHQGSANRRIASREDRARRHRPLGHRQQNDLLRHRRRCHETIRQFLPARSRYIENRSRLSRARRALRHRRVSHARQGLHHRRIGQQDHFGGPLSSLAITR
jgi:hypothetical protein